MKNRVDPYLLGATALMELMVATGKEVPPLKLEHELVVDKVCLLVQWIFLTRISYDVGCAYSRINCSSRGRRYEQYVPLLKRLVKKQKRSYTLFEHVGNEC
ncbi:hypothetical protein C5167_008736 [Papaver somniferum]|uniref:Uncharacterized protein n=1 Tax=Papaver somniferum TaxID=3469 RepID=A0A4Y7JWU7_PAPSO|nr:hypothetical protein C5167_008736 [Papaver somniferum]